MSFKGVIPIAVLFLLVPIGSVVCQVPANSNASSKRSKPLTDPKAFVDGKTVIAEVVFRGLDRGPWWDGDYGRMSSPLENLMRYLRADRATFEPNEKLDLRKVEKTIKITKEFLSNLGYFEAKVSALGETIAKSRIRLIISVDKGLRAGIASIGFAGTQRFADFELTDALVSCLGDEWRTSEWEKVRYCADRPLREYMWTQGYLKAKVLSVARKYNGAGFAVTIEIGEGAAYRYGKIEIEGNKIFSREQILEMLGRQSGDILNGAELRDFVYDTLRDRYVELGYLRFSAEFNPVFLAPPSEGMDPVADIKLDIEEGKQFKVGRVEFVGVAKTEESDLREAFPLRPGDVFSQKKLDAWVKAFNETGKYKFLDAYQHVELRTNDEQGDVHVAISISVKPSDVFPTATKFWR